MELTDDDLRDAALAARVMAVQWQKDAATQLNPGLVEQALTQARRFAVLAERFEEERR